MPSASKIYMMPTAFFICFFLTLQSEDSYQLQTIGHCFMNRKRKNNI